MLVIDDANDQWHPDMGVMAHITNDKDKLVYSYPYKGLDLVIVGNRAALPVTRIGTGSTGDANHLALNNILVVPQMMKNLLSVS